MAGGGVAAALGPADDREEADALLLEPGALLPRGELQVGLGPLARPVVLGAVEPGGAEPVLPGQLEGVVHAQPALLRGVDEEQPAEGPPGLAAEGCLGLLLEQDHPLAGVGEFRGGHEAGQPRPHDDDSRCSLSVLTVATLAGRRPSPRRPPAGDSPGRAGSTRRTGRRSASTSGASGPTSSSTADHIGPPAPSAPRRKTRTSRASSGRTAATARTGQPRARPRKTSTEPARRPTASSSRDDEEQVEPGVGLRQQPAQAEDLDGQHEHPNTAANGTSQGASRAAVAASAGHGAGRGERRTGTRERGRGRRHAGSVGRRPGSGGPAGRGPPAAGSPAEDRRQEACSRA